MSYAKKARLFFGLVLAAAVATALACGGDKEVPVEVIKQVQVPVEVVVAKEVVKVVEVPVEKIVEVEKEVVVEVEKVEIVEVVKEVPVEVEKEVVVEVVKVVQVVVDYPVPGSELVIATPDVGPKSIYKRSLAPEPMINYPTLMGVTEQLLDIGTGYDAGNLSPMIARGWTLDETGVVFIIRNDVPWHDSKYGFVTPEDILWSYDEQVKTLNGWIPEMYIPAYKNQRVEGDKIIWEWSAGRLLDWSMPARHEWQGIDAQSMAFFEEHGEAYVQSNAMGTGPYMVVNHVSDDRIELEGVKDHWRIQPGFETVTLLEVSEQATRIAMIVGGNADGTEVAINLIDQVADLPGVQYHNPTRAWGTGVGIRIGGNWRIRTLPETHADAGEPSASTYRDDLPWVGRIDDPADLERARKLRQAMSVAIDRELINNAILGGNGCVMYSQISVCDPHHQPQWNDPYDPEFAKQLLAEAGYPDGLDFDVRLPSDQGQTFFEVGEALVAMWNEVGLNATIDATIIGGFEEFGRGKQMNDVFIRAGGSFWTSPAAHFYLQPYSASIEWGEGFDYPEAIDMYKRYLVATDAEEAWEIVYEMFDFNFSERFHLGVVAWKDPFVTGERVGEVLMHIAPRGGVPELESFRPALQ